MKFLNIPSIFLYFFVCMFSGKVLAESECITPQQISKFNAIFPSELSNADLLSSMTSSHFRVATNFPDLIEVLQTSNRNKIELSIKKIKYLKIDFKKIKKSFAYYKKNKPVSIYNSYGSNSFMEKECTYAVDFTYDGNGSCINGTGASNIEWGFGLENGVIKLQYLYIYKENKCR